MIIDSHAHLLSDGVETDKIIQNMSQDGLEKIITIGTDVDDSIESVETEEKSSVMPSF